MEHTTTQINNHSTEAIELAAPVQIDTTAAEGVSTAKAFIEANTVEATLEEIKESHIIPVFIKDNEPVISHVDFIETMQEVANDIFQREIIMQPAVRLSHPVQGRIPEAKHKRAIELLEHEKTIYYERMAFVIEIPSVFDEIGGNLLSLTVGGVKAYNLDNLYNRKGADEHFKVFIGFRNKVCTNLCIWTDGYSGDLKVKNRGQLRAAIVSMIDNYSAQLQLSRMRDLHELYLSEHQFATLIGKCKMYQHLPKHQKEDIYPLALTENHISTVTRDFYNDPNFSCDKDNTISLWKVYNLFTGANKSSYIDNFLDRSVNVSYFIERLQCALLSMEGSWYLS